MDDVERSTSDCGRSNDLVDRLDAGSGLLFAVTADVSVNGRTVFSRQTKHLNHFPACGSGRVLDAHTNGQRTRAELVPQTSLHGFDLLWGGQLVRGSSGFGQQPALRHWRAEGKGARSHMARRGSIVDEGVALHGPQECRDIGLADFHFKRSGHAVKRFNALAFKVLAVLVQVNESWSHDQASGENHTFAIKSLSGDFLNLALGNADIANSIKACLRIEHPAALDHKIVVLR